LLQLNECCRDDNEVAISKKFKGSVAKDKSSAKKTRNKKISDNTKK